MTEQNTSILLKGGTLLVHGSSIPPNVEVLRNADLLIEGSLITQIGYDLSPPTDSTRIIPCDHKIICPGFVDTHHHVWQTQLKGRHSDDTLLDYTPKGNLQFHNYTPSDIFWGELAGLLEAVDAGTTCVVDHAHMTKSAEHEQVIISGADLRPARAGFDATLASGIRSVFCYSLVPNIARWDGEGYELANDGPAVPTWFLPELERLCERARRETAADGDAGEGKVDRVRLGLGFDSYHLPREEVVELFTRAREIGVKVITSHWRRNNITGDKLVVPKILDEWELLGPDIILSHGNGSTDEEFALLKNAGSSISITPGTETQMAHGDMVAFREDVLGSLGADLARAQRNSEILHQGKFPKHIKPTTLQAFNLATIDGARAIGTSDHIGSLAVGKQADITIFDTKTPAMACAAEYDPLVAVVRHAGPQEVGTVIVAGRVLKDYSRLCKIPVPQPLTGWLGCEQIGPHCENGELSWYQVLQQLRLSSARIQQRIEACSMLAAREKILAQWGAQDSSKLLV